MRVNLISPGAVAGPRIESAIREQARVAGISYEAAYEETTKTTPLRRLIPPEDIAAAAVFLASDASASITGEDMNLSGGLAMYSCLRPPRPTSAGRRPSLPAGRTAAPGSRPLLRWPQRAGSGVHLPDGRPDESEAFG